jgi:glutaredoxin
MSSRGQVGWERPPEDNSGGGVWEGRPPEDNSGGGVWGGRPPEDNTGGGRPAHTITLLTRPGCHLCDEARAVIERVAAELGVSWQERDITGSAEDLRAYSDMIPVTLIDGVQHDFWRVSERRLRAALTAPQRAQPPARG